MSHAIRFSYWKRGKFGCLRRLGGAESIVAASGPHKAEERELERMDGVFVQLILPFSSASPHLVPAKHFSIPQSTRTPLHTPTQHSHRF